MLKAVAENIQEWGWKKDLVDALIDKLPDLDEKWAKKWQKAVKNDD